MSEFETLSITCKDQYLLSGRFYPAQGTTTQTLPILVCPATGITSQFYHSFNLWLQQQGYNVLCFDFRGIGQSLHGPLRESKASIVQWGQLDIPAAIEALLDKTQAEKVILLGHSAGGQLLGLVKNFEKVAKVVAIAGSSGNIKGLKGRTQLLAPVMFLGLFPLGRYTVGYGPTQMIGMGENLPKDVAQQWAYFCMRSGYIKNAVGKYIQASEDFHHLIKCPIVSLWASDDEIATAYTVRDFLRIYPNAPTSDIELKPQQFGHKSIGHMLMFKKSHQNLWPIIEEQFKS